MARCPRCEKKIYKRKSDNTYNCPYHGFVRKVNSYTTIEQQDTNNEQINFISQLESGLIQNSISSCPVKKQLQRVCLQNAIEQFGKR